MIIQYIHESQHLMPHDHLLWHESNTGSSVHRGDSDLVHYGTGGQDILAKGFQL